jgi:hypothetical protein
MKKLLIAIVLMAFGTSANAVIVIGTPVCSGQLPSISCITDVTCNTANGKCPAVLTGFMNAICLPVDRAVNVLAADTEGNGGVDAFCTWTVTDLDESVEFTVDASNGLPVELQSLSIE